MKGIVIIQKNLINIIRKKKRDLQLRVKNREKRRKGKEEKKRRKNKGNIRELEEISLKVRLCINMCYLSFKFLFWLNVRVLKIVFWVY